LQVEDFDVGELVFCCD